MAVIFLKLLYHYERERQEKYSNSSTRRQKNNVWSHKNFIISWHKVGVMKSFFFGGVAEKWAWSPATSDKFGSAPYFLPFFWLPPLGGVTGRLTFIPPYGNFFLSAGWKKKWQIESENLVCATKHQINWKLLRGMRIITILQSNRSHSNYKEI